MSSTTIEIVLELDGADRPSGTAAVAGGEPQRFDGWLELVTLIGALAPPSEGEQAWPSSSTPTPSTR